MKLVSRNISSIYLHIYPQRYDNYHTEQAECKCEMELHKCFPTLDILLCPLNPSSLEKYPPSSLERYPTDIDFACSQCVPVRSQLDHMNDPQGCLYLCIVARILMLPSVFIYTLSL